MRNGAQTKERLLKEATMLITQRGISATSINNLLREAKVTKGAFFHHFPDKDALGHAVLEHACTDFLAWLDELLEAPTPLEGLHRFFAAALKYHQDHGFIGGCIFGNLALEMSDTDPRYANAVRELFCQWQTRIEETVQAGQRAAQIRRDCDAFSLAQTIVATIEGGIMLSRLQKDAMPLQNALETLKLALNPAEPLRKT